LTHAARISAKGDFVTDQDHVERINALTRNARATWFTLLAALVFVGITLMGVEHIDFYGVDRATTLPVVNIDVPTPYFFFIAPCLIAAIYGYFHLYMIRLFDALGAAPDRLNSIRLGDAIAPWLVADAALDYRARKRNDNSTTPRVLEIPETLLNLLLASGFGLVVRAFLYWLSLPARSFVMSGIALASLAVSLFAGFGSFKTMRKRLRVSGGGEKIRVFKRRIHYPVFAIGLGATVFGTYLLTEGPTQYLAPLDLSERQITLIPWNWFDCETARKDALELFAEREGLNASKFGIWSDGKRFEFNAEWLRRHDAQTKSIGIHDLT
jgi:hypothetical protein